MKSTTSKIRFNTVLSLATSSQQTPNEPSVLLLSLHLQPIRSSCIFVFLVELGYCVQKLMRHAVCPAAPLSATSCKMLSQIMTQLYRHLMHRISRGLYSVNEMRCFELPDEQKNLICCVLFRRTLLERDDLNLTGLHFWAETLNRKTQEVVIRVSQKL